MRWTMLPRRGWTSTRRCRRDDCEPIAFSARPGTHPTDHRVAIAGIRPHPAPGRRFVQAGSSPTANFHCPRMADCPWPGREAGSSAAPAGVWAAQCRSASASPKSHLQNATRFTLPTTSKWLSSLSTERACWRASAAIQRSFGGMGAPSRFNSSRISAYATAVDEATAAIFDQGRISGKPLLIAAAATRLPDTETVFAENHARHDQSISGSERGLDSRALPPKRTRRWCRGSWEAIGSDCLEFLLDDTEDAAVFVGKVGQCAEPGHP